jgi:hypothetical protein
MKLKDGNYLIGLTIAAGAEPQIYILPHRLGMLGLAQTVTREEFDMWMADQFKAALERRKQADK